jgi:predicted MPP superfamily phosphohydrolase
MIVIHVYFAQRLVLDTALPAPWSTMGLAALALAGSSIFARPVAEMRFGPRAGALLGWPAHLWLGCCFYLLIALGIGDAVSSLLHADGVQAARTQALSACGAVSLIALLGTRSVLAGPRLVRVEHAITGWPAALDGYRIVQLSDVHVGAILRRPFIEQLVARSNALEPDVIAITGDLVDGELKHYGGDLEPLRALRARDGAFFVTGNHDHYSGGERWAGHVAGLGVRVLRNAGLRIERDGAGFELAGVDDYSAGRLDGGHGHDLERALAGWDGASPLVLLAHDPRSFAEAQARGVHLQLSGHTHGGQMWPFAWLVRLQTPHVAGVYERGRSRLYVSRGTGFWGPPMRVLAKAELTLHVMRSAG